MIDAKWRGGLHTSAIPAAYRDKDSSNYVHPAEYLFQGSPERIKEGETPDSLAETLERHGIDKAMLSIDPKDPAKVLDCLERYPTRFWAKLPIDPREGMEALRKMEYYARTYPLVRAIALTPMFYQLPPNDKVYYPVYAKAIELGLPVTVNVGIPGPRVPGECQNPLYLDEVMYFFPELTVVMAHGGEPWEDTCVKLMLKWPNLYYYTSAFAPKHYPKAVIDYANTRGADKVFYAGYYPAISLDRLQNEMANVPLRPHVWPKFLRENAIKVFKLGEI
ncbi:amidohydrolase family protein [Novosphingobium sp. G106]|nr:amidohydrolase family protein [Novosphingobium sp. G106]